MKRDAIKLCPLQQSQLDTAQDGNRNCRNEVPSSPDQSSDPNPDRPVSATTRADLLAKCRVLAQAAWEKALGSDHEHFTELATFYLSTSVE